MNKRNLFGIFVVLIGVLFLLDTLGYSDFGDIIGTYWPMVLIIFGVINLFDKSSAKIYGMIALILGIAFQLTNLNYFEDINIWNLIWPIILILIGVWLLVPKKKYSDRVSSTNTLNNFALFSSAKVLNQSHDFAGGDLVAIFGGIDADLRNANISSTKPAIIDAMVAFGGVDIIVPVDWKVQVKGIPLFGGWSNKTQKNNISSDDPPVLIVKGLVMFGGLEIKHRLD